MSRFLNILLSYNVTLISLNPDFAPVLAIKILHHDNFLAPLSACTATLRQCPQQKSCTVIVFRLRSNLYPRHSLCLANFVPGPQKHVPYTSFPASLALSRDPGTLPSSRNASGNMSPRQAGPVKYGYCRGLRFISQGWLFS